MQRKLINQAMRLVQRLRLVYWKIAKPVSVGVRAIVLDDRERVLLVRHSYAPEWYLPGGRVRRSEGIVDAVHRELDEEVGVKAAAASLRLLGTYSSAKECKRDHISVFVVRGAARPSIGCSLEVLEQRWCSLEELPEGVSPGTRRRLQEYAGGQQLTYLW